MTREVYNFKSMVAVKKKYPIVAVIGRPNVGKSTLFNRLLKERRSIVDGTPGVTRDILYADIEWNSKGITLIDTGGLVDEFKESKDEIISGVKKQVYLAIEKSDFVVFLVDGKDGITSDDGKIASYLRKIKNKKKIFLAVNKIDTEKQLHFINEFYSLGLGEPYAVSALSGSSGLADILDQIINLSSAVELKEDFKEELIKIAIVGKPNVGKSSILNSLVGEERAIVTSVAGTTRDSIDSLVNVDGKDYLLIDTAGLRRKSKVSSNIERYATTRAISAIEKADIVLFVIDVSSPISDQDQKIAQLVKTRNKGSIILANKCDLIDGTDAPLGRLSKIKEGILSNLHFVNYSKILFTTALKNKNVNKVWPLIDEAYKNYGQRISTGKLNKTIENIILSTSLPGKKGKQLKIFYVTQASTNPPEIIFFVNDLELASEQYSRFLEKEIRKVFDFSGTPIKMVFRNKKDWPIGS